MAKLKTKTRPVARETVPVAEQAARPATWWEATWFLAGLGSLLTWAAFPPLNLAPLAWLAAVPWLLLVRQQTLSGKRPYLTLYLAGGLFWLATIHWLRLPHPATFVGWFALSFYLAVYLPLFVGLSRLGVHRAQLPLFAVAPVVWVGLEYARAHLLTGFSMAYLGHTQYQWIGLIQISDLAGAYAVSFVVMFVAACLAEMLPLAARPARLWPLLPALALLAACLGYGAYRTSGDYLAEGPRVAVIQGNIEQDHKIDPDAAQSVLEHYLALSRQAVRQNPDVMVWPETMYRYPVIYVESPDASPGHSLQQLRGLTRRTTSNLKILARELDARLLIGADTRILREHGWDGYNAAYMVDPQRGIVDRYDKIHRVMFGEYVPFADFYPDVYRWVPVSGIRAGSRGQGPLAFDDTTAAISICFESTVPHLIRHLALQRSQAGNPPDLLINLTNDGWFWGSSELDMHLICGVFRAVECRKPMLVAANTGFSAHIDSDGRILWQGPRQQPDFHVADVQLDRRWSPYLRWGDWPAAGCLLFCLGLAADWGYRRFRRPRSA